MLTRALVGVYNEYSFTMAGDGGAGPHSATGCSDGGHWSSRTRRPGQRGALLYPHQHSVTSDDHVKEFIDS